LKKVNIGPVGRGYYRDSKVVHIGYDETLGYLGVERGHKYDEKKWQDGRTLRDSY